jgi:hypothetical protein
MKTVRQRKKYFSSFLASAKKLILREVKMREKMRKKQNNFLQKKMKSNDK